MQLRTYVYIDRMQPQYAAFTGKQRDGMTPIEGMAQIYIEISPAAEIYKFMDVALKTTEVRPGFLRVEREFGFMEIHSHHQQAVKEAGDKVLSFFNLNEAARIKPEIISSRMISNIDPYQAQMINSRSSGGLLLSHQTLCVIEVVPAAYIVLAANEAEKAANITLVHYSSSGAYGRLYISGTESDVSQALNALTTTIVGLSGRSR